MDPSNRASEDFADNDGPVSHARSRSRPALHQACLVRCDGAGCRGLPVLCIDVNSKGVPWGIAAALPHFKAQKSRQFINVSSVTGHTIGAGGAIYTASKDPWRAISEALRKEVKPYHIRTTVLSPGAIDTDLPTSGHLEKPPHPTRR